MSHGSPLSGISLGPPVPPGEHLAIWQPASPLDPRHAPSGTQTAPCGPPLSAVGETREGSGREPSPAASSRRGPGGSTEKAWLPHQTLNVPFCLHVVTSQSQMRKLSRDLLCNWDWNAELLEGVTANQKYPVGGVVGGEEKQERPPDPPWQPTGAPAPAAWAL